MKNKIRGTKTAARAFRVDKNLDLEDQVAQRAHELWHQRGYERSADLADWFQAERELHEWHRQHGQSR